MSILIFCILLLSTELFSDGYDISSLGVKVNVENTIEDDDGNKLVLLDLNDKNINDLTGLSEIKNMEKVHVLDLSNNHIENISADQFVNFKQLKKLIINSSNVSSIKENAFRNLPNLEELSLATNDLVSIPNNAFDLKKLKKLDLSKNRLTSLGKFLQGLTSLEELMLHNNKIDGSLKYENFQGLSNLKLLNCERNNISSIDGAFKDLKNIETIKLAVNKIFVLDYDNNPFDGLYSLKIIQFPKNYLQNLNPYMFSSMNKLESLFIFDNRIQNTDMRKFLDDLGNQIKDNIKDGLRTIPLRVYPKDSVNFEELGSGKTYMRKFIDYFNGYFKDQGNSVGVLGIKVDLNHTVNDNSGNKLVFLDLSDKKINNLNGLSRIKDIDKVSVLDLSRNHIESISADPFIKLKKLKKLIINASGVSSIKENAFRNLSNLEELSLSTNDLESISNNAFAVEFNKTIKKLDLSVNRLEKLDRILQGLSGLEEIMLHDNKIAGSLKYENLKGLSNLKFLDCERNNISKIEDDAFQDLEKLDTVKFMGNKISKLDSVNNPFNGLKNLKSIQFPNNDLTLADPYIFSSMNKLTELFLFGNTIKPGFVKNLTKKIHENIKNGLRVVTLRIYLKDSINFEEIGTNELLVFNS